MDTPRRSHNGCTLRQRGTHFRDRPSSVSRRSRGSSHKAHPRCRCGRSPRRSRGPRRSSSPRIGRAPRRCHRSSRGPRSGARTTGSRCRSSRPPPPRAAPPPRLPGQSSPLIGPATAQVSASRNVSSGTSRSRRLRSFGPGPRGGRDRGRRGSCRKGVAPVTACP